MLYELYSVHNRILKLRIYSNPNLKHTHLRVGIICAPPFISDKLYVLYLTKKTGTPS